MLWPPQRAQFYQSVSLVSLDWTGEGGVIAIGDHCGLSQSTYEEVSANSNGPVSDVRKVAIETLFFMLKAIMKNYSWLHLYLLFNRAC